MSINIQNISKAFGNVQALKEISLEVNQGERFGLIGPDGAGKTTLFRILTTLLLADSGQAMVMGKDVVEDYKYIRHHVGYMPGRFSLYQDLTVEENLTFFATVFGTTIAENYDLIKDIYEHIEPFKNRKAGALSGGMKQKLALSCALIHKPKVLFLDEPTTGVDPVSRQEFWEMLIRLQDRDITIFVSTAYMDEASLCDRVALIQKGEILITDKPDKIASDFPEVLYNIKTDTMYNLLQDLRSYDFQNSVFPFGEYVHYSDQRENFNTTDLKKYLSDKQHKNIIIEQVEPTIEDRFMKLMQSKQ